jgi:hypothetical protein
MTKFIEIVDKDDSVKLINVDNISYVKVNSMAICSLMMNDGTLIETDISKESFKRKFNI